LTGKQSLLKTFGRSKLTNLKADLMETLV
jgi:hypothetical protein